MSFKSPSSRNLLALASFAALALPGCQAQPNALLHVGTRVVTEQEFRTAAATVAGRIALPPDSAKGLLVENMVQRELLLEAANGNPALPDSYMTRRRKEITDELLWRALSEQLKPAVVAVSDAEVKQLYLWRQQATRCQLILATDPGMARQARAAVDAGEDFGAVADRFDVTSSVPDRGDLGFVDAGSLIDPLDRLVRESPVGSVVGPTEAPGLGWFIIKVLERRPHEQPAFAQVELQLRKMLEQRKQRITTNATIARLREAYQVTADAAAMHLLYQRLNESLQLQGTADLRVAAHLSAAERARPIGRWDGGPGYRGSLTLGEAVELIEAGRTTPLDAARLDAYDQWVKNVVLQRVTIVEARRRHLDEEPANAAHLKQAIEEVQLQAVLQTEVRDRAEPNDEEIIEAYERNAASFAQLKSVDVQYMTLPDSALAVRTAEKAMDAGTLKNAVMVSSASFQVREVAIRFPTTDPLWQMLQPALAQQQINGLLGPIRMPEGWRVVQIIARDAPVPQFAQLTAGQQGGIRQQAREMAAQRRLQAYTDSLRSVIPVVVDRNRLRRIAWPTPTQFELPPGMTGMPGS